MAAILWVTLLIASVIPDIQGTTDTRRICTSSSGKSDFDTSKFLGTWYIIKESSPSPSYGLESISVEISSTSSDTFTAIVHCYNTTSQKNSSTNLSLQKSGEGKFLWIIPGLSTNSEITVVETDYTNYAVWQMCIPPYSWAERLETWSVASRTSTLEDNLLRDAEGFLPEGNYHFINH